MTTALLERAGELDRLAAALADAGSVSTFAASVGDGTRVAFGRADALVTPRAENDAPPELFGHSFHLIEEPNRYGIPAFCALHAWAWKDNPTVSPHTSSDEVCGDTGAHEDWNPSVLCPTPDI